MGEWIAAVVGATAGGLGFLLSVYAVYRSTRLNKRDLFLTLHEKLSTPEQVCARQTLRQIKSPDHAQKMRRRDEGSLGDAVSALAMLDILGLYVERNYVNRDLVLSEWGWVITELSPHADHVIEERRRAGLSVRRQWPHFRGLALEAFAWRDRQLG
jgi:hypothetical protein